MPTISLFTSPTVADAFHQVTAPGGYEWWYFDAEDTAGDLRMVAIFFQGFVFHPSYLRRYAKYAWWPTRNAPPLPAEYPCVYFIVYRGSEIVSQFMSQYPANAFSAATDSVHVHIGNNHLATDADGSLNIHVEGVPWTLTGRGPRFMESQKLSADFFFKPRLLTGLAQPPMERRFFSKSWSGADHHWVIANPLCGVTGAIELADSITAKTSTFAFSGLGYHDHNYGTGPIGPGLSRWMWGRMLMDDHVVMFHFAQPSDVNQPEEIHLIEADAFGVRQVAVDRFQADWSLKTSTLLRYPAWVEAGPMQLANPRVVDSSPFYMRVMYDASVRGRQSQAFCEIAYPHRLRWPVLGRMIEMSIQRKS